MADRNYHSIADVDGFDIPELILDLPAAGVDASQFDDILKFSAAKNGHIGRLVIRTGGTQRENAIDFNRGCENIVIDYAELEAGAENAITIKGGCHSIRFGAVDLTRAGGHCDIELGNHSDQVYARTTDIAFDELHRDDGQPFRIRWGFAEKPFVGRSEVKWQWWQSLLIRAYVHAKHLAPFLAALLAALTVAGCTLWPSTWRIGGSPLDRVARAGAKLDSVQGEANRHVQAAVHKAEIALSTAPADNRSVAIARDFVAEARALSDQANGAPNAADEKSWQTLVAGLVSENAAIRAEAEKQRTADAGLAASLASRLAAATSAAERANERALAYARDREDLADFAGKLKLGFFGLVGLLLLGTVLSLVARFVPALGLAAKVVNGVVAPGLTFVAHRAEAGLQRVGQALSAVRTVLPEKAAQITQLFDSATDADHQAIIAAAALAAGAAPPAS